MKKYKVQLEHSHLDFDAFYEKGIKFNKIVRQYVDSNMKLHTVYNVNNGELLDVNISDLPRKMVTNDIIYFETIGYQRRWVNKRFYEDCNRRIIKNCIFYKKDLVDFMENMLMIQSIMMDLKLAKKTLKKKY